MVVPLSSLDLSFTLPWTDSESTNAAFGRDKKNIRITSSLLPLLHFYTAKGTTVKKIVGKGVVKSVRKILEFLNEFTERICRVFYIGWLRDGARTMEMI